ncbi:MAG: FKBP-type peptidyl-prolyl cis-trans isomerase [Candidatus Saccharibacteria bacterium]
MARVRDRIFAGFGAFLFLGSACALTIFVILQPGSNSAATNAQNQQASCDINTPVSSPAIAAPDVYKPDGAVTTLQITDLTPGTGAAAKNGDCLVMKYYGTLAATGAVFDQDFNTANALQFTLGQGQVITGWDNGLVGMKVGGTRRLVIPAAEAYGSQSPSAAIPANSDLVFIVKLVQIKKV